MAVGDDNLLGAINLQQQEKFAPAAGTETPAAGTETVVTTSDTNANASSAADASAASKGDNAVPAFNESEYLTTNFGVGNLAEAKSAWSGLAQLQEQNKALTTEVEQYKPLAESLKKAGEVGKLFVDGIAKGIKPETLAQVYNLKPEDLSPEQAWKWNQKLQHPNLTDGQINALFNKEYSVEEGEVDQTVIDYKSAQLAIASESARSGIKDYMGKTLNPVTVDPAVEQAAVKMRQDQLKAQWEPALPALASALKEVTLQIPIQSFGAKTGELTNVDYKFSLPEAEHKAIMQAAYQTAVSNGVVPDAKGLESVKAYAHRLIYAEYGAQIVKAYVADTVSHMTAKFEEIMNNPNLAKTVLDNNKTNDGYNAHERSVIGGMSKRKGSGVM